MHHVRLSKTIPSHGTRQKTQSEKTKKTPEPDSDMVEILRLSDWKFKITITMPKALMEKKDNR